MNLQEIENDIIAHLERSGNLGRLYSERSSRISNTFNPYRVTYRYWLNENENTQITTVVHFKSKSDEEYNKQITLTLKEILGKPYVQCITFSDKVPRQERIFGKLLFEKSSKKVEKEKVEVTLTIINQSYCEGYMEDSCEDCPSNECSIYSFKLEEKCVGGIFQQDPRIKDDFKRYFVTENIVAYKITINEENESSEAEFRDYGVAPEEVQKPKILSGTIEKTLNDIFGNNTLLTEFSKKIAIALKFRGIKNFYDFQVESIKAILACLQNEYLQNIDPSKAFLLHAATAGGKTEGFLLPIFMHSWIEHTQKGFAGVKAIIFYPTKALADDQYDRILYYLSVLNEGIESKKKIRLGILHGDVPKLIQTWCTKRGCNGKLLVEETGGKIQIKCNECGEKYEASEIAPPKGKCPWCNNKICYRCKNRLEEKDGKVFCPSCKKEYTGDLRLITKVSKKKEKPERIYDIEFTLYHPLCGSEFDFIDFTRDRVFNNLPDILITNPDIIHTYITKVPSRSQDRSKRNFAYYDLLKIFRLFGKTAFYCAENDFIFDSTSKKCPICKKEAIPLKSKSKPAFLVVDEIHLFRGNFGCNASGFFSTLIHIIKELTQIYPICISSTATVSNKEYPPGCLFGFPENQIQVISPSNTNRESPYDRRHIFILPKGISSISCLREILVSIFVDPSTITKNIRILRNDRKNVQVLVFFDNKRNLYETNATLTSSTLGGARIRAHTADISKAERRVIENQFLKKQINVLLATSTLEVGVDFDELNLLINFGATYSYNNYLQRIGRVGRKGPALVVNILRYSVPIDNYYFENFRELIVYSHENVDIVPITRDIPKSVRRNVFPLTAAISVLTGESWNIRRFYDNFLRPRLDRYKEDIKKAFLKPPMIREDEVASELDNVCGIIESKMRELSAELSTENGYVNDALDKIAHHDITQRLDFNLRINEKAVNVSIKDPKTFINGLEGSLSGPEEESDIEELFGEADIEIDEE